MCNNFVVVNPVHNQSLHAACTSARFKLICWLPYKLGHFYWLAKGVEHLPAFLVQFQRKAICYLVNIDHVEIWCEGYRPHSKALLRYRAIIVKALLAVLSGLKGDPVDTFTSPGFSTKRSRQHSQVF